MLGWELPPHNSGGLGVACFQMAKALAQNGAEIDFVLPYKASHPEADAFMNVLSATDAPPMVDNQGNYIAMGAYSGNCPLCGSRHCKHARTYTKGLTAATHRYADQIESMVRGGATTPKIIHAHDWLTMEAGIRAKEATGAPLIVHVHATEFDRAGGHSGNPLIHDIEYFGMQAADRIFAVSQITKDIIVRRYGIPAGKVEVVHNSIDPSELSHTTSQTDTSYHYLRQMKTRGYKIVTGICRLTVQKGLSYLIEAATLALSRNPKLIFVIGGSGEQRNQLVELAADLGISDRVIFTGFVRGARFRELYEVSDMFVMPSISEPFGLTALEAAYYDTAVLLSKTSGVGEVLHNVMRFDYWDTRKLADQIVGISLSPALQSTLVEGIKQEYLRCNWGDVARKMMHQYSRVIANHRRLSKVSRVKEVVNRG